MKNNLIKNVLILTLTIIFSNNILFSQQQNWSSNPKIVDTYDPTAPGFHRYNYKTIICEAKAGSGCTIDNAFKFFLSNSKYIAPTYESEPVKNESTHFVMISLPGIIVPGLHPIKVYFSEKNHVVINYTLPGHALHPGMVERKIVQEGKNIVLLTTGTGYSNAGQFLSSYQGSCANDAVLEALVAHGATMMENFLTYYIKELNGMTCITSDVWQPVDLVFSERFKASINISPVISQPATNPQIPTANRPLTGGGGTTAEELGKLILKAFKTNDKELYKACIHPNPYKNDKIKIEEDFERLKEEFAEQGLSNWSTVKYSRVTFTKDIPFGSQDGGERNGEQVRRSFTIEFTFNNQEFTGRMEGATIVTFKNRFYIWNGGFATRSFRL